MLVKIINNFTKCIKFITRKVINIITIIPRYFIIGIKCILDKKKRKELNLEHSIIPTTIIILSLLTYLISIFVLTRWYVQNERIKKFSNSINEETDLIVQKEETIDSPINTATPNQNITTQSNLKYLNINLNYYIKKNPETVAWIQVNGTNINYPIVKHSDNDYYLKHDFYQKKSNTGWIFADYRNDFNNLLNNTIIYGHNLINKTMFGSLPNVLKASWYNNSNNRYIKISTTTYNSIWQIFSVYKTKPTIDYLQTKFNSLENYHEFLQTLKNKSIYDFNIDVTYQDKIVTLSTCDDTGTQRIVVHAKLYSIETK